MKFHWTVEFIRAVIKQKRLTMRQLERIVGIPRDSLAKMSDTNLNMKYIERCMFYLGYRIQIVELTGNERDNFRCIADATCASDGESDRNSPARDYNRGYERHSLLCDE